MNYNTLRNKPTINYRELIGDNTVTEVGGITEEQFTALLNTDLAPYYTKDQIDDLFSRSYVYREKSGSIVTFDCPASVNGIDKVVSEIVAVQSGTGDPSPANVRPFTGWSAVNVYDCGVNLYDIRTNRYMQGVEKLKVGDTLYIRTDYEMRYKLYIRYSSDSIATDYTIPVNETVTIPLNRTVGVIALSEPDITGIISNNKEFTISLTPIDDVVPYQGTTTPIQFIINGETKTIYSGYVEIKNGKVKAVATHGLQPLTDWNWTRESAGGGNYRFRSMNRALDIYERASSNCISSVFTINRSPVGGAKVNNTLWVHTDGLVYVYCDTYTDATVFKEFVKDTQLLLPLVTPIEYDLADVSISTQEGTNNLWADSGDVTVKALDKIIQG